MAPKIVEVPPPVPVAAPRSGPPIARTVDTVDHQFGLDIPDPYRWMEGNDNAEYKTWLTAHGDYAKGELAKSPGRDKLHARIRELGLGVSNVFAVDSHSDRTIYSTLPENAQLAKLATRDGTTERILVDPEKLGSADAHASLDAYSLSPDGKYVGYLISLGGGEASQIHVMEIATGKDTSDLIDHIWGEFAPSWLPDSKAFFYTQMVSGGDDPMQNMVTRYHVLGAPVTKDVEVLGHTSPSFEVLPREFPGAFVDLAAPGWVFATANSARSESRLAIAKLSELDLSGAGKTPWKVIAGFDDAIEGTTVHGGRLYLSTFKGAPNRKIISVPLEAPDLSKARLELAEEPSANLATWNAARDGLYLVYDVGGVAKLSRWAWSGKPTTLELPGDGWINGIVADDRADGATYNFATWLRPSAYFAYDPKTKKSTATGLAATSKYVDDRVVATEVEVPSDGVSVPLSILHFKDIALDKSHPTLIDAYGAYGSSQHPYFSALRFAWLEQGGVRAVCHVRGGGERGRKWQDDGSRQNKLNGVHDLIACAEYLVAHGYTSPQRLAIAGGSAGGILMGRTLDERPDLFAVVHIAVGMVNPLRILAAPNGANQIAELGDPQTEGGYKSIAAMDPYVNVKPAADPSVIFTVGLNDRRVVPWMTGKLAARLLATTTSKQPILIRVEADAGHGIGSTRDQSFAETADVYAFMFQQFDVPLSDR
jgi:prolyl oligopeptidase